MAPLKAPAASAAKVSRLDEAGLSAAAIGGVLDQLSILSKALQDRDAMRLRVEKMESDQKYFLAEVAVLATDAEQPLDHDKPDQTAAALAERLEAAERSHANRLVLADDRRVLLEARDGLMTERAAIVTDKTEVLRAFGVATLDEVVEREDALRDRDRLRAELSELEEQLSSDLGVDHIQQVETMLEGVGGEGLVVEQLELEQRLKDIDEALKHIWYDRPVRLTGSTRSAATAPSPGWMRSVALPFWRSRIRPLATSGCDWGSSRPATPCASIASGIAPR
jgi:hypothetical protein